MEPAGTDPPEPPPGSDITQNASGTLCLQAETNPVLKNITDYLIEEVSAEEEELIGASGGNAEENPASSDVPVETDEKLLKVGALSCSVLAV